MEEKSEERMNREKRRRWPFFAGGVLCGALLSAGLFVWSTGFISIPFLGSFVLGRDPMAGVQRASASEAARDGLNYGKINLKLRWIDTLLSREFYYEEDPQAMEDGIFTGLMYGLSGQDPYAAYFSAEEFAEELIDTRGNYYGIGALISQDPETKVMTIAEVYADSPAKKAGLKEGDILKEVNQEDVTYMELSTVVDAYVKGPEGSYVNLTVDRSGEQVELQIQRGKVEMPSVYASMLKDGDGRKTGYIYVSTFEIATVGQFQKAVNDLTAKGAEGLIIDLRDNPGGVMESALSMLDYLIEDTDSRYGEKEAVKDGKGKALLLYTEGKQGRNFTSYAEDGHAVELPMAVLINEHSASASEIFAQVMKDYEKAEIVGVKSYGKGIVQTEEALPDGSAVKYTSAQYFTPSDYAVHGVGVMPDVTVDPDEAFLASGADAENPNPSVDNQLREALTALYAE